jgi:hypothetical protein
MPDNQIAVRPPRPVASTTRSASRVSSAWLCRTMRAPVTRPLLMARPTTSSPNLYRGPAADRPRARAAGGVECRLTASARMVGSFKTVSRKVARSSPHSPGRR